VKVWEAEAVDLSMWGPDDSSVAPRRVDRELFTTKAAAKAQLVRWNGLTRNGPTSTNLNSEHWHCGKFGYSLTELEVKGESRASTRGATTRREEIPPQPIGDANDGIEASKCVADRGQDSLHSANDGVGSDGVAADDTGVVGS
jgi:hypothetical protein